MAKNAKETVNTIAKTAKQTAQKIGSAAKPVVEKSATAVKKAADTAVKALKPELYVEYAGRKFDVGAVTARCKKDYRAKNGNKAVLSCRVYIKPEDNAAYYVINEIADKIFLDAE